MHLETHVTHQRDNRVEDLRDTTPECGRADVEHPLAGQRLRELADLLDQTPPDEMGVVGQRALTKCNVLQHADRNIPAASATRPWCERAARCRGPARGRSLR